MYKSISESFIHAGASNDCHVKLSYVNSEKLNRENVAEKLGRMAGILVAPGFGNRGIEGKIEAVRFARENGKSGIRQTMSTGSFFDRHFRRSGLHIGCF